MCLTLPAQILKINGTQALIRTHQGLEKKILISAIQSVQVNDWIMINGNLAVQKVSAKDAQELLNILN